MTSAAMWVAGARPRTLPAAVSPVVVGTGLAIAAGAFVAPRALLALIVAVALQVGVNYANDYSDGIRGTDDARVGPIRLVGQGLALPGSVRAAAFLCFLIAALAGLGLGILTGEWWLVAVGLASIAAAWLYTGGPRPYGYLGLGEVFVLVFFGIVPVMGTAYVQTLELTVPALLAGLSVGLFACAVLVTNNLRDIPGDTVSGKHTLAVRLGDRGTRVLCVAIVVSGFACILALTVLTSPWTLLGLLALPWAIAPVRIVASGARGPGLIPALKSTGTLVLVTGFSLGLGLALG
ncbi:MAG: 1,4-dihydroxy-2-naphthoate polyprenyltransferase [Actinobacteria bacterium]|nr:1,4-dihydroxy-2-naphthoate polyprenyltransferase [Actinomycetota bacterium]